MPPPSSGIKILPEVLASQHNYSNKWAFLISLLVWKSDVQQMWGYTSSVTTFSTALFFSLSWPSKTPGGLQWWTPLCESADMMFCASFFTANLAHVKVHLKFHFHQAEVHQHQSLCQALLEILPAYPCWTTTEQTSSSHHGDLGFSSCYVTS